MHHLHSELPSIAEDTLLATLRERYLLSKPYTALSSSGLIALNPFASHTSNSEQSLQRYAQDYREGGDGDQNGQEGSSGNNGGDQNGKGKQREPHVFALANDAYYHMKRTGQDQSILLR